MIVFLLRAISGQSNMASTSLESGLLPGYHPARYSGLSYPRFCCFCYFRYFSDMAGASGSVRAYPYQRPLAA